MNIGHITNIYSNHKGDDNNVKHIDYRNNKDDKEKKNTIYNCDDLVEHEAGNNDDIVQKIHEINTMNSNENKYEMDLKEETFLIPNAMTNGKEREVVNDNDVRKVIDIYKADGKTRTCNDSVAHGKKK